MACCWICLLIYAKCFIILLKLDSRCDFYLALYLLISNIVRLKPFVIIIRLDSLRTFRSSSTKSSKISPESVCSMDERELMSFSIRLRRFEMNITFAMRQIKTRDIGGGWSSNFCWTVAIMSIFVWLEMPTFLPLRFHYACHRLALIFQPINVSRVYRRFYNYKNGCSYVENTFWKSTMVNLYDLTQRIIQSFDHILLLYIISQELYLSESTLFCNIDDCEDGHWFLPEDLFLKYIHYFWWKIQALKNIIHVYLDPQNKRVFSLRY